MQGLPQSPRMVQRYEALRRSAEAAVIRYLKWPVERCTVVEYYDGNGYKDVPLRRPYVVQVANVWLDATGAYAQSITPFPASTLLTAGGDYVLVLDDGSAGKSGLLRRLTYAGFMWPSDMYLNGLGGLGYMSPARWPVGYGNLKVECTYGFPCNLPIASSVWANGVATLTFASPHLLQPGWSVQVCDTGTLLNGEYVVTSVPSTTTLTVSLSGSGTTAAIGYLDAVPPDIKAAVVAAVGVMDKSSRWGYPASSESLGAHSYSLSIGKEPGFGEVRQLLSLWRDSTV